MTSAACNPVSVAATTATTAVSTAAGAVTSLAGAAASAAAQAASAVGGAASAGVGLGASGAAAGGAAAGGVAAGGAAAGGGEAAGFLLAGAAGTAPAVPGQSQSQVDGEAEGTTGGEASPGEASARPGQLELVTDAAEAAESCLRSMFDMRGAQALLSAAGFDLEPRSAEGETEARKGDVSINLSTPMGLCIVNGGDLGLEAVKALVERAVAKITGARLDLASASAGPACASGTTPAPGGIIQIDLVPAPGGGGCNPSTAVQIIITAGEAFL